MPTILVNSFEEWRRQARLLLAQQLAPNLIQWCEPNSIQTSLFDDVQSSIMPHVELILLVNIPRAFIHLAQIVAFHRAPEKWNMLYTALWRLSHGEKHLLQLSTDHLVYELFRMRKSVTHDAHKMKAFVRFKLYKKDQNEFYIAWHRSDHPILELVAPFFKRRFSVMKWLIVTPDGAVCWDGEALHFDNSLTALKEPIEDEVEDLWKTYYRSIFNPARIKLKAMRREMPVRYWSTLPETQIIGDMLNEAPKRVAQMIKYSEGIATSAADYLPKEKSIEALRDVARHCQACALFQCAKQTVFGVGPSDAKIVFVGEQPGDQEDQHGSPFVGPAGQLFDQLLQEANIRRQDAYVTNTVKHFKHTMRNGKRLHVSPNTREINACKPWVIAELEVIQPQLIICLGVTAARALISHGFHMKQQRGNWQNYSEAQLIMATYHPSAILRATEIDKQQELYSLLLQDIKSTHKILKI